MMKKETSASATYYAIDIGASNGRAMVVTTGEDELRLQEAYRFGNGPLLLNNNYHWDVAHLLTQIKVGLRYCHEINPHGISFAIDTWGTDFGLLDDNGDLLSSPLSYRQFTSNSSIEEVSTIIPDEELYGMTGIQFMSVNTLYQLVTLKNNNPALFEAADKLLMMPDLLNYLLCGSMKGEYTNASTTQILNPVTQTWEKQICERLGISSHILPKLIKPGTLLGKLFPEQAREASLPSLTVRACASHDTASAVAAVPAEKNMGNWVFISSGTWSLVGTELAKPLLNERARQANVTNEAGVNGTIRLLKNITGLWLLQRLHQDLSKQGRSLDFNELLNTAKTSLPFQRFIKPNAPLFHQPTNMVAAIDRYCLCTSQKLPVTPGEYARCIIESLAFAYKMAILDIENVTGKRFEVIHVIGGGAKIDLLNTSTANACGIPVLAGPIEATAIGNVLVQAMADGIFSNLQLARQAVKNSFTLETFHPEEFVLWEKNYSKYCEAVIHNLEVS